MHGVSLMTTKTQRTMCSLEQSLGNAVLFLFLFLLQQIVIYKMKTLLGWMNFSVRI